MTEDPSSRRGRPRSGSRRNYNFGVLLPIGSPPRPPSPVDHTIKNSRKVQVSGIRVVDRYRSCVLVFCGPSFRNDEFHTRYPSSLATVLRLRVRGVEAGDRGLRGLLRQRRDPLTSRSSSSETTYVGLFTFRQGLTNDFSSDPLLT